MEESLKRCPFCGGEARIDGYESGNAGGIKIWYAICDSNCGAMVRYFKSKKEAVEAWNRRLKP